MNSIIKGTDYIISCQSTQENAKLMVSNVEFDMKNKLKTSCNKCLLSGICNCLHEKQADTQHCHGEDGDFLIVIDEDNGLNSEIEKCVKLLSPEITRSHEDVYSYDFMERELFSRKELKFDNAPKKQQFLINSNDKKGNSLTLKEGNVLKFNEEKLLASKAKNLSSVGVKHSKDIFKADVLDSNDMENNFLKSLGKDNGLNAEIERCIKLLTPTNKKSKRRKNSNDTVKKNKKSSRKKLKLDNNEMKKKVIDSNKAETTRTSVMESKLETKPSDIQIVTPKTKHRRDVIKNYFLKYKNKDNLIKFSQGENILNSEIKSVELGTPVKKINKEINNINQCDQKDMDGEHFLKSDNNKLTEEFATVSYQNKTLKSSVTKECHSTKSKDGVGQNAFEYSNKCSSLKNSNKGISLNSEIVKVVNSENAKLKTDNSLTDYIRKEILPKNKLKIENNDLKQEMSVIDIQNGSKKISSVIIKKNKPKLDDDEIIVLESKKSDSTNAEDTKTDIIADYYEDEKDDLIDPGWLKVKELTTNEERYLQVKRCWRSKYDLNPNKNLTYHSYRKRMLKMKDLSCRQIKQHKRHASTNLNGHDAKRSRPCTYKLDDEIKFIQAKKEKDAQKIMREMRQKISAIDEFHLIKQQSYSNYELGYFIGEHQRQIENIKYEYDQKARQCDAQYRPQLESLNLLREEILQFYGLFKDVNKNQGTDPTILSQDQLEELDEIEKIYMQMDKHYS